MAFSLDVGLKFAKSVALENKLEFPFIVTLLSGGHALIALALEIDKFILLGTGLDTSPGDVFDKVRVYILYAKLSRSMRLASIADGKYKHCSGGEAMQRIAEDYGGDYKSFEFTMPRSGSQDCDFSFSGLQVSGSRLIDNQDMENIQVLSNISASLQYSMAKLVTRRIQRAVEFVKLNPHILGKAKALKGIVLSGGVAANSNIKKAVQYLSEDIFGLHFSCPPQRLCTDNGVMIAWNTLLLWEVQKRVHYDIGKIDYCPNAPFGIDYRVFVRDAKIKLKSPVKIDSVF